MAARLCAHHGCGALLDAGSYCPTHTPRSLSSRRTGTHRYQRAKRAALRRAGYTCETAGCAETTGLEVHHRVPVSTGGSDALSNLVVLCVPHHHDVTHGAAADGPDREHGHHHRMP
ncbi:MAG: HNH endonuclease [Thermoleophilaceae bacterium]|nr:HNH endonuclease [Thermoleophilaceae bacterium]